MWAKIKKDILILSEFDKRKQLFGAEFHNYAFGPLLTEEQIKHAEEKLNIKLPTELRDFYTQVGNGEAGPHYGLAKLETITGYRQSMPYPGAEYFKELAKKSGTLSDDDYFEVDHKDIKGLITIIQVGCGHEICLVSSGKDVGKVVYVSINGFVCDSDQSLGDLYRTWLRDSIAVFQEIEALINTDKSMADINQICIEKLKRYDGKDLAMSLIGAKKPSKLFGSKNVRKYHGAKQFPWYEKQLKEYRKNTGLRWWKLWKQ